MSANTTTTPGDYAEAFPNSFSDLRRVDGGDG